MRVAATLAAASLIALGGGEASAASGWFEVTSAATYLTGDSWTVGKVTYRLYGVQSCLRGTSFTNLYGLRRDCGEASLAMLVALTRDLRPQCYAAAERPELNTVFVFCMAQPATGAGAGSRIDLGTALIALGYAFAALTPDGKPVHPPYFVAELVARRSRAGLWAFPDIPNPNPIILRALAAGKGSAGSTIQSVPAPGPAP